MEKMNLLICDDEWMIRESIVQTALSMEEFNVFTAVTGRTALELLEEEEIDGVVLDMQMPEMDGITFLQHMKSRKKDCAVIVLSGHDEFDYAQKCLHYGAIEYLLKPVTSEQIRDFLMQLKAAGAIGNLEQGREVIARSTQIGVYEPQEQKAWDEAYEYFLTLLPRSE